ncbi:MAG TPA: Ku protein [Gemmatimonadales bacterium]|jgi:DNA end-binding protein Ku|nr:Ku protein [Gemmatimonadales bacterium]
MARAIWKGSLSFGLVSIGVELETVEAPERLDLDLLDRRDMARIGYQKFNKSTGKTVDTSDIVRGYAVSPNHYVVLNDTDIKAANPKASRAIDIVGFVKGIEIPPIFLARPYFVIPGKGADKPFALFHDTLQRSGRVAIAQVVLHTRQYVTAIYPYDDILVAQLLRYESEMRTPTNVDRPALRSAAKALRPAEREMASQLMNAMDMAWEPEQFRDTYRDDILKLVKERASHRGAKQAKEPPRATHEPKVLDLVAALRQSLPKGGQARAATRRRSPRTHRRTA